MAPMPTGIRVAQTLGITTSAFVAGSILSISFFSVPALLLGPSPLLARQWKATFDRGKIINPAIAVISGLTYGFLSYRLYGTLNHPKAEMYAISAVLTLGIVPWTRIVMWPTNTKLFKKHKDMENLSAQDEATEIGLAKGESTKELVDKWGTLNFARGLFPLVGAALATWVTLS